MCSLDVCPTNILSVLQPEPGAATAGQSDQVTPVKFALALIIGPFRAWPLLIGPFRAWPLPIGPFRAWKPTIFMP